MTLREWLNEKQRLGQPILQWFYPNEPSSYCTAAEAIETIQYVGRPGELDETVQIVPLNEMYAEYGITVELARSRHLSLPAVVNSNNPAILIGAPSEPGQIVGDSNSAE